MNRIVLESRFDMLLTFLRIVLAVCLRWICPFGVWPKLLRFSDLAFDYPLVLLYFSAPAQQILSLPA